MTPLLPATTKSLGDTPGSSSTQPHPSPTSRRVPYRQAHNLSSFVSRLQLTRLTETPCESNVMSMAVQFSNPELQAKVEQWVSETGRPAEELMEDAMTGYFEELAQLRETLDSRYDDIKNGRVKMIPGEEAFARLKAKSDARRKS